MDSKVLATPSTRRLARELQVDINGLSGSGLAGRVTREDVMHARIKEVASELADGETVPLMLAFAERQRFSDAELVRLQQMIDELKTRAKQNVRKTDDRP